MHSAFAFDEVEVQKERIARAVHSAKETRRTGFDEIIENAAHEAKTYPLPVPSRLEQQYMAAARLRQKENIVTKQVVWGKEFKGVAFFPKPAAIEFKDFEVGKVYTRKVVLTNISYTFNAFKLLPLPDSIRDFFVITYPLQGAMSAGTSCVITVTFQPKLNEDIIDELPALAQTGPFAIPLICLTKKVAVEVQPAGKQIDFGQVVLAESMTQIITIINHGALSTEFDIIGDVLKYCMAGPCSPPGSAGQDFRDFALSQSLLELSGIALVDDQGNEEPHKCISMKPHRLERIEVEAHSKVRITMGFHPTRLCQLDSYLLLRFADSYTPDYTVFIRGQGVDIPVFVDQRNVLDLYCCYFDTLYRDVVVLKSRGKTSMRCQPLVPAEMKNYLSFVPKMGFIQPGKTMDFQLKFIPDSRIKQQAAAFYDAATQRLEVPIQVEVQGQTMPIFFTITAFLTSSVLLFTPASLDFGPCCVSEGLTTSVAITNTALLPQEVGFIGPPPEIRIRPRHGFASILPKETVTFDVDFFPSKCGEFHCALRLKTHRNEEYALPVKGAGRASPMVFSEQVLYLKRAAIGETVEATVLLRNVSKAEQAAVFKYPNCSLTLQPSGVCIPAGGAEPVLIKFNAQPELFEPPPALSVVKEDEVPSLHKQQSTLKPSSKGKKGKEPIAEPPDRYEQEQEEKRLREQEIEQQRAQLRQHWQQSGSHEPFSFHRCVQVWCCIEGWELHGICLEVHLAVVLPEFLVEPATPSPPAPDTNVEGAKKEKGGKKGGRKTEGRSPKAEKSQMEDADDAAVQPVVVAVDYSDPQVYLTQAVSQLQTIQFGDAPSGKAVTQVILIRRVRLPGSTQQRLPLTIQALDPYGPFSVIKPPEPIAPGEVCEVVLQFKPNSEALFCEQITIVAATNQELKLRALGRGLWPSLQLQPTPPHPHDTEMEAYLNMGNTLSGEYIERQIKLHNPCPFDLSFEARFQEDSVEPFNWDGSVPFAISPFKGAIPKGGSTMVTVSFSPDHEFDAFRATAYLFFGREDTRKTLYFTGSGWNQGMYLLCPTGINADRTRDVSSEQLPILDPAIAPQDLTFFSTDKEDFFTALTDVNREKRYILEFHCQKVGDSVSHTVLLGNNKSADPKRVASGGEYMFEGLTDLDQRCGFKIEPSKGTIEAGGKRQCTVSFCPTKLVLSAMPVSGITVTCIANVRCTLKGGTPPRHAHTAGEQVHTFVLKGLVKVATL